MRYDHYDTIFPRCGEDTAVQKKGRGKYVQAEITSRMPPAQFSTGLCHYITALTKLPTDRWDGPVVVRTDINHSAGAAGHGNGLSDEL